MKSSQCILGERVDALRAGRLSGASVSQLVAELRRQNVELYDVARYFCEAFLVSGRANIAMIPKLSSGEPDPRILDGYITAHVDAAREQWLHAPPYPDLMRRRDRIAFEQVARKHDLVLIVCAADRSAAQYIGKSGYKPDPQPFLGVPRRSPPNQGLMAADPDVSELSATLNSASCSGSYDQRREELERRGMNVGSAEEGYIIRDQAGQSFYPGYRLHGAYRSDTGSNAWTGAEGQHLRAELNRRLGEELVISGPLDVWTERLEFSETDPLRGPQPPVLFFLPSGDVQIRSDALAMELYYRFLGIDWDALYPSAVGLVEEAV